jgi:23S rRNA pseudouridine2605 synthase
MKPFRAASAPGASRTGLARALSKLGYCSRSEAWSLIEAGRVRLNGRLVPQS